MAGRGGLSWSAGCLRDVLRERGGQTFSSQFKLRMKYDDIIHVISPPTDINAVELTALAAHYKPSPDAPPEWHQTIFRAMKQLNSLGLHLERDGSSWGPQFDLDYPAAALRASSAHIMPRSRPHAMRNTLHHLSRQYITIVFHCVAQN
ncbi:hypothetical protein BD779DRAFT_1467041 [Infundibulicybe gibba]|nr:hypothetical protein BD779DRAFT_1467041 [Infundibulicybe gibba]